MKFIHIADPQLGYRQYGLQERYQDFIRVHDNIVEFAVQQKPDAVVYAGDIFEKHMRSADLEMYLRNKVKYMQGHGIKVLGIEGNHDLLNTNASLEICDIWPLDHSGTHPKMTDISGFKFWGINYCPPGPEFKEKLAQVPDGVDVLVLHQTLSDVFPLNADISAEELVAIVKPKGVRYVAMGHIHNSWQTCIDGVHIVYPGSTEMTDIDEKLDKYIYSVDLPVKGLAKVSMHRLNTRPIGRTVIDTPEQAESLIAKILSKEDNQGIFVVSVNRQISKMIPRLEHAARSTGTMLYVNKIHESGKGEVKIRPFERANASTDLKGVVGEKFQALSDQYSLTMEILSRPSDLITTCTNYLKEKKAI